MWMRVGPIVLVLSLGSGCAGVGAGTPSPVVEAAHELPAADCRAESRAEKQRREYLESEVASLRVALGEAEATLVSIESGLLDGRTRADAVSAVAAARIEVQRAKGLAPWQGGALEAAAAKLEVAQQKIDDEHFASAFFFASQADRVARRAIEEAELARREQTAVRIEGSRVNLRDGPGTEHGVRTRLLHRTPVIPEQVQGDWLRVRTLDGTLGWVHGSLIRSLD